jgi:hypothetical protein
MKLISNISHVKLMYLNRELAKMGFKTSTLYKVRCWGFNHIWVYHNNDIAIIPIRMCKTYKLSEQVEDILVGVL